METVEQMQFRQAKKYIRGDYQYEYYLKRAMNLLENLQKRPLEGVLLYAEALFHLGKKCMCLHILLMRWLAGNHERAVKFLDKLLVKHQHVDIMIHKAVILHQLGNFNQALECYQAASQMAASQSSFNFATAIEAIQNQQIIPWPFNIDSKKDLLQVWTNEEIIMIFVLHPNAVASAKEMSNKNEAIQFMLNELDAAEIFMNEHKASYPHIYPVEYLFKKLFKDLPIKFAPSAPKHSELSTIINQTGRFNSSDRCLPFVWQLQPKSRGRLIAYYCNNITIILIFLLINRQHEFTLVSSAPLLNPISVN
jgi:tetratricopeptide (TPR) repeat protein